MSFTFTVTATDGAARTGTLETPRGTIETPVFMPVGTHGAVKSVSPQELEGIGSSIILGNTYHLYLRPGDELIRDVGGLHSFTQWNKPLLTDSGGFQVFSLGERGMKGNEKKALRTVSEEGITFKSHLDGSSHLFTPEKSIAIQQNLGSDIMMAFDQPVYGLSEESDAEDALHRTHRWLERSAEQWKRGDTERQALFGIVQGGIHTKLHTESAAFVSSLDLPGNAIGGLSVGESKDDMWAATSSITCKLPGHKPRYFMGLGEPIDVIEAALRGVDMYDCVSPSRLARHGTIWQLTGSLEAQRAFWDVDTEKLLNQEFKVERWNMNLSGFRTDAAPLVPVATRLPEDLQGFSRATLNHYLREHEMLGYRILTLHNIAVLQVMTEHVRKVIHLGQLNTFRGVFSY
ncbi:MAG TPA: tRNA guanosine(34) transglycosylase Tgt [Verrucomicrobiae bacterium]|nr:tRNA guanosine(34) transglycosylase Tgt [Verrucomicrobiae bacterium]